jgi:hypothetical protein
MGGFDILPSQLCAGDVDALVRQLHREAEPTEEMKDRACGQDQYDGKQNDSPIALAPNGHQQRP